MGGSDFASERVAECPLLLRIFRTLSGSGTGRAGEIGVALLALLVLRSEPALAVPAAPGPQVVVQPDGTRIKVYLRGDEFLHWHEDERGFTILREPASDRWVYGRDDGAGGVVAGALVVGRDDPAQAGLAKHVMPRTSILRARAAATDRLSAAGIQGTAKVPRVGIMKNLVLLVNFNDTTPTHTREEFDSLFNTIGYTTDGAQGSVKDFYREVSYNRLTVDSVVTDWITLDYGYAYYGANDAYGNDVRPREMVQQALAKLEARGFDFTSVDADNDGWVDGLTVIHAGGGEEYGGNDPDYIWSHKWSLSGVVTYDGKSLQPYHTEPERRGWDSTPSTWGLTRIGVICHENGHFLGLPDLYDYGYDSQGAGNFCLMAGGSWNGNLGSQPAHPSAWCKMALTWLTPTVLSAPGSYSIGRVEDNQAVFRLNGTFPSTQYFLIENRQGAGFDASLPGSTRGLLIWHVDENQPNNNDQTHYKVDLEEASGTQHLELNQSAGDDSDYFRQGNATVFSAGSTPNNLSYAGVPLGLDVASVSASGNTMTVSIASSAAAPANDNWADSIALSSPPTSTTGNNINATTEPGEQQLNPAGATVWWHIYAPADGLMTVDTFGSDFDTVLHIYTGRENGFASMIPAANNDDAAGGYQSQVTFPVNAGKYYEIRVGGYGGAQGNVQLHVGLTQMPVPVSAMALWLKADAGVSGAAVAQWSDQSGNSRHAAQGSGTSQPALVSGVLNGLPVVRFDGANDFLTFDLPVNGLGGMTLFLVAANTQNQTVGPSQAERAALFWNETAWWGTVYLSPFQSSVAMRFGTTQAGNQILYTRPSSVGGAFTITTALKNGSTDSLFVNGVPVLSQGGKLPTIAGCRSVGNIGRGFNDNTYYAGDIAEVIVYPRALTEGERQKVELYLHNRWIEPALPNDQCAGAIALAAGVPQATSTATATATGDPVPTCTLFGKGAWYRYMPATTGPVIVSTCGSDFDTALSVYTGDCAALTPVPGACADDDGPFCQGMNASMAFRGVAGTTYYILAGGWSGASGHLQIMADSRPATTLTVNAANAYGVTIGVLPLDLDGRSDGAVEFTRAYVQDSMVRLTAPAAVGWSGFVKWQRDGTDFSVDATVTVTMDADHTLTAVYQPSPARADLSVTLQLLEPVVVPGREYLHAAVTVSNAGPDIANSVTLTEELPPYTTHAGWTIPAGWSQPTLPIGARGTWSSSTPSLAPGASADFIIRVAIDTSTPDGTLITRTVSIASAATPDPNSANNAAMATAEVHVPPPYDECPGAIALTNGVVLTLNTSDATEYGELGPPIGCFSSFGKGVWFTFTPDSSGPVAVSTCGSDFDTLLQVYTGSCAALTPLNGACTDNNGPFCQGTNASLAFNGNAGTTYYLLAVGYAGASGNLNIVVSQVPAATLTVTSSNASNVPISVSPLDLGAQGDGSTTFTRSYAQGSIITLITPATAGGNVFLKWERDGTDFSFLTNATVTMNASCTLSAVYREGVMVSGRVVDSDGVGVEGVAVSFSNGGGLAVSDMFGNYSNQVAYSWTGTATPELRCYTFAPASRDYSNVLADQANQNYVGGYSPSVGNTFYVSSLTDAGPGSLRQAMLDANAACGGDIVLSNVTGTITLESPLPTITANMKLLGPGTNLLTISGNNSWRVIEIARRTTNVISGLTIADGRTGDLFDHWNMTTASGIHNAGALQLRNCVVRNCHTVSFTHGGGIFNSGALDMEFTLVTDCFAAPDPSTGGGIYNAGTMRIKNCVIARCDAWSIIPSAGGGGIYNGGNMVVIGTRIESCVTDGPGGGIWNRGSATLDTCIVADCGGDYDGGGIASSGNLNLTNTSVLGNRVHMNGPGQGGGGISASGIGMLSDCTVALNGTTGYSGYESYGGGVLNNGNLQMYNCTVSQNISEYGGGLADSNTLWGTVVGTTYLNHCTVVSNSGPAQISVVGTFSAEDSILADCVGTLTSLGYNLIQDTNGCNIEGTTTGNLYGVDPLLGPLQDNGGPTWTLALLPGSPAIDSGTAGDLFTDQRGGVRPFDILGVPNVADGSDIGAVEMNYIVPANDLCDGAIVLATGEAHSMNTAGATDTGDPVPSCAVNFGKGVWYRFTSATTGPVVVDTCGSDFDTLVEVFTGSCGSLIPVAGACRDDSGPLCPTTRSSVAFIGTAGTTYTILAGGFNAESGNLNIVASQVPARTLTVNSLNPASGVNIAVSNPDLNAAQDGTTSFTRSYAQGSIITLTAPALVGGNAFLKWQQDGSDFSFTTNATVTMDANHVLTAVYQSVIPSNPALWLKADAGVSGSPVSQWSDQSGSDRHATQATGGSQPVLVNSVLNGLPVVRFDGANDFLTFNLPVNGLGGMTIFLVAANTQNQSVGASQAERAALFWNETAGWGTVYLSPFQSSVAMRFGTTQSGNRILYARPTSVGSAFTITTALKNSTTDTLFVNGVQVLSQGGKLASIEGCRDTGNVARGYNDDTWFAGDIAEVVVYTRALTTAERQQVEQYLNNKWFGPPPPAPEITVLADGNPVTDGQATAIDFGSVVQGQTGVSKVFTVRNDGNAVLNLGTPSLPAGYTLAEPLAGSLAAGAQDTFTVQLDSAAVGVKSGAISITNNDGNENPFDFPVTGQVLTAPPANDQCAGAIELTDGVPHTMNTDAATETGDPLPSCVDPEGAGVFDRGVWYRFTPAVSGPVLVETCGSDFDTMLQLYTGSCGALTPVVCNSSNGPVCQSARASMAVLGTAGTTYTFLVGGAGNRWSSNIQSGNLSIVARQVPARTLTVSSANPDSGLGIAVSLWDLNWAKDGTTSFTRSYAQGSTLQLTAPATADGKTFVKWQRDGVDFSFTPTVTVTLDANHTLTAVYQAGGPVSGMALWLKADAGVSGSPVSQWADQSGNNRHATQGSGASQPALVSGAINGLPAVRFDGANDFLTFDLPVNGLGGMTIFLVAANTQPQSVGPSQAERAALFWNETAWWGTVYLSPFQSSVAMRFGTTQAGNTMLYNRPASAGNAFTLTTALKDGTTDTLFVNGAQVLSQGGKLVSIEGCRDTGNVARGYNDNSYFAGDIAEVLIYTRALTTTERQQVEQYLRSKYALPVGAPQTLNGDVLANNPALRLRASVDAGGMLQITVTGSPGKSCVLEQSADLRNWAPIQTITLPADGPGTLIVELPADAAAGFFRARVK